jgi:apolipoprotein N-acyltransferase
MQLTQSGSVAQKQALPSWCLWAAAGLSAGLLELPFPLAGPMLPWRSVFAWFGLAPLIWAVLSPACSERPRPLRRAFLLAWVCGVLWFMGNCYWIYDTMLIHGGLPPAVSLLILLLFSLVLGLYFGLFGWGLQLVRRVSGSTRLALVFAPFLWVALELVGARFTSVPWDQLGYSQVDNGILMLLAPWTGVYGISFVLVAVNTLYALGWLGLFRLGWRKNNTSAWAFCFGLGMQVLWFGYMVMPREAPTTATAVLIQPNLDVEHTGYWNGPGEWDQHIADFIHLGGENCKTYIAGIPQTGAPEGEIVCPPYPTHPDLIVWPESPAPFFEQDPRFQHSMADVARAEQAPLVVNGIGAEFEKENNDWRDYVSAMVFDAQGKELGRYDKIHLVPWGEYVPFKKFFFFVRKLTGKVAAFTPGDDRKVFHLTDSKGAMHRYGIFICYEAVFADEIRQFAKNGAEVFVTGSDDGWYGDTSAPWQLLNMARMRAMENRRWILRATNDGITAVIDPYGRVRQSIPRHRVDALPAEFGYRDDTTFYTKHGDVFAWLCAALSLAVVGWAASKLLPHKTSVSSLKER